MRGFGNLLVVQAKLFVRETAAFFFTLVFPAILLLTFGLIFGNDPLADWGLDFGYVDLSVPALAAIIIGSAALIGVPTAVSAERETGVLRRYRATPVSPMALIAARVTIQLFMCALGMAVQIGLAALLYGLRFGGSALAVTVAFLFATLAFLSLGFLIASVSPTARVAQTIGMGLFFPLMFLSGAAMPRQIMPEGVQAITGWLPLTQVVTLLQGLWLGGGFADHLPELGWLVGFLLVGTMLSVRFFRWE